MSKLIFNGQLFDESEPVLTASNRAFRYGDALFETIRIANKKICFWESHRKRLEAGLITLKMNLASINFDVIKNNIETLISENGIKGGGRVRVTFFRKDGGLYTPETNDISYLIECDQLEQNLFELNKKGLNIDLYEEQKKTINKLSSLKSTNCLTYILAGLYKKEKKLDDVVLLNELGSVAESVSSNIFVVINKVYYTPSVNQGIVPGVMREQIIKIAQQERIEVQECQLSPQVLLKADEILLTNAISGVKWVVGYRTKRYYCEAAKFWVKKLNDIITSSS